MVGKFPLVQQTQERLKILDKKKIDHLSFTVEQECTKLPNCKSSTSTHFCVHLKLVQTVIVRPVDLVSESYNRLRLTLFCRKSPLVVLQSIPSKVTSRPVQALPHHRIVVTRTLIEPPKVDVVLTLAKGFNRVYSHTTGSVPFRTQCNTQNSFPVERERLPDLVPICIKTRITSL